MSPMATLHGGRSVVVELPLRGEFLAATFDLEKAVCSHGLFMMAPNHWNSHSKTLQRPLRLDDEDDHNSSSLIVQISHPSEAPHSLLICVFGTDFLSPQQTESLLGQVRRMLRLTEEEEKNVREFQELYIEAKERGFGRIFRSPTLFEDMVKCMLLCNCQMPLQGSMNCLPKLLTLCFSVYLAPIFLLLGSQNHFWWPRTLSMVRALCELQLELQCPLSNVSVAETNNSSSFKTPASDIEHFALKTPEGKEKKRKTGRRTSSLISGIRNAEVETRPEENASLTINCAEISGLQGIEKLSTNFPSPNKEKDFHKLIDNCRASTESHKVNSFLTSVQSSEATLLYLYNSVGNFPSPRELASLDEKILAKRCKLGYRASRIVNLARSIVEGRIQLKQLEEACIRPSLSNYNKLAEQLKEINGFGPYTCANVLMCMGFYHVVPSDSETIRHIKQVHARNSSIRTIEQDIEVIYGKYAPFQFLAYWSEVWSFYEGKFGKLSEMPHSDYKLITASNLRPKEQQKQED